MVMTKLKNMKYRCEMEHLLVGYVKQRDLELDTIKITEQTSGVRLPEKPNRQEDAPRKCLFYSVKEDD